MTLAYLHLILNHIPVVGIPVALAFLVHGVYLKDQSSRRFALLVLVAVSAVVLPVYLTGEPAEELVEHLPGVVESVIETHEDASMFSLVLTLVTGAAALAALWFQRDAKKSRTLNFGVMALSSLAVLSLLYTARLGGQIRRPELRPGFELPDGSPEHDQSETD